MSNKSLQPSGLARLAAYLSLSLIMPLALFFCLLFRPDLGLQNPPQAGDSQQQKNEVCEETNFGPDVPDGPRPDLDVTRIYVARLQYHYLVRCRRLSQILLHTAHTTKEWRFVQNEIAQSAADFQRLYHEITPAACGRAHLPRPEKDSDYSQVF